MTGLAAGTMPGQLGFATGYDAAATVPDMARTAADAERAGFDMGFFSETFYTNRDSVSAIAGFASTTTSMMLGTTQVVRLRSPLVMAQTAATLAEMSNQRLVLVLGACTDKHARRHALPPQPPARVLVEYIQCIRALLTGVKVTYRGEFVSLEGVGLNWQPSSAEVPIWVAGATPLGLRTAAEHGDGVLLDAGTSPEYVKNALAIVASTRAELGRSMDGFAVAQLINTSIEASREEAISAVRWEIASKFKYASTARGKVMVGEPNIDPDAPTRLSEIFAEHGEQALLESIPDEYVINLTASGTPADVRARVERYREAGVTLPLLRPAAPQQVPRLLNAATELRGISAQGGQR